MTDPHPTSALSTVAVAAQSAFDRPSAPGTARCTSLAMDDDARRRAALVTRVGEQCPAGDLTPVAWWVNGGRTEARAAAS
jgi:hypothetical protein